MQRRVRSRLLLAWLLIAAAVLLRAALPVGWMPVAQADGVRILLCTGDGPASIRLDQAGNREERSPQPAGMRDPCPFGIGFAMSGLLPQPPAAGLPPQSREALAAPARLVAKLTAWRALRPPATGPPSLA